MENGDAGERESRWKRFCPKLAVYVPKYVTVQNPKLGLLYTVLTVLCIAFTLYYFFSNDKYILAKFPDIEVALCGVHCLPSAREMDALMQASYAESFCNDQGSSFSRGSEAYSGISCVGRCGSNFTAGSCVRPDELVQMSSSGFFVTTFFRESFSSKKRGPSCPQGLSVAAGNADICQRAADYYVAGADRARLIFNHEFSVTPHKNSLDFALKVKDLEGHSGSFNSHGWDKSLVSILFAADGTEVARFDQTDAINLTVSDLLGAAYFDGIDDEGALTLDTRYMRPERGMHGMAPLRLTGVKLTLDLYTTSLGKCPVYDTFREKVRFIEVESGRPVTCILVHADRNWVTHETSIPVGHGAGLRTRTTSGIRIEFRKLGKFTFLDEQQIMANLTVFFVWIQIPLQMTYWFCVLCLGMLSAIYSRVLHQELSLVDACKGLVARLVCHSAAFMDLQDHKLGLSKARIRDRFKDHLADNEDIDDEELGRFVDFVFEGLKSTGKHLSSHKDYVSVQEFCEVCSSDEPLKFGTFVRLFDSDRHLSILERFFTDATIREMHDRKTDPQKGIALPSQAARHSRIEETTHEVQELLDNLKSFEGKVFRMAKDLDVGQDVLQLLGQDNFEGTVQATVPPKSDQRESVVSIADEDELSRRGR
mmetsp:Transcript_45594/g.130074  ORF Transcript_45594/g.130074 Transcript_45594/m.130074 type:complete len:650 (-) Transcript_45594:18-1967(-)